jgi:hypothetical protein
MGLSSYEIKDTPEIIPMGAGATMSSGKKARELTSTKVNKKIAKMTNGIRYSRKNGTTLNHR